MKKRFSSTLSLLPKAAGIVFIVALALLPLYSFVNNARLSFSKPEAPAAVKDPAADRQAIKFADLKERDIDRGKTLKPFDEPIISVDFDDGWLSSYQYGIPVMQKYGIPGTHYILPGMFNSPAYMSKEQVRSLLDNGHEIGSHTLNHANLDSMALQEVEWQLSQSKAMLSELGTIRDFSAPYSAHDSSAVKDIEKRYYRSGRSSDDMRTFIKGGGFNKRGQFDPYDIKALAITRGMDQNELKKLINSTIEQKGWLILLYHQIDDNPQNNYGVSPAEFEQHMKLVSESQARVAASGKVLDAMGIK